MNDAPVDLIGRLLKAIASTPNRGDDEARYQLVVAEPARALRRRWEDSRGAAAVEPEEARRLVEALLAMFAVKRVEAAEQRERLHEILTGTALEPELPQWVSRIPS